MAKQMLHFSQKKLKYKKWSLALKCVLNVVEDI